MVDKRFWSGAVIAATVMVAGASALPALLLAPTAPEPMIPVAIVPPEKKAALVAARIEPQPVERAQAPVAAQPAPSVAAPTPQVAASPPPATPMREAAPMAFPPVQPIGVATSKPEPAAAIAAPAPAVPRVAEAANDRPVTEKPARAQRGAAQRTTTRKRQVVRPAVFPLREFLAWRR